MTGVLLPDGSPKGKIAVDPKSEKTKQQYRRYYEEHMVDHLTVGQIAQKHGKTRVLVGQAIKWAAREIEVLTDPKASRQVMLDKLTTQLQALERMMLEETEHFVPDPHEESGMKVVKKPLPVRDRLAIMGQIQKTCKLIAQVQSILQPEGGGPVGPPMININLPDLQRGQGTASVVEAAS